MKTNVRFTLSPENVKKMREAAAADQRSSSQWIDILLSNHFRGKKK